MWWTAIALNDAIIAALILGVIAIATPARFAPQEEGRQLINRAFSDSPTGTYAPGFVKCPNTPLVRQANGLSALERDWVVERKQRTNKALTDFLNRANMVDFDVAKFMGNNSPTIAIAFSGGGYRAMLNGGGVFASYDSRTPGSTRPGNMGGLVQSATYISGLSGGSWMLSSIVVNNFTTIPALQAAEEVWDLRNSILVPDGILRIRNNVQYYQDLHDEVTAKENAGFPVSLTDYWGRALSRQFIDFPNGGPAVTYSSIAKTDTFRNFEMPFPIIVAVGRHPGELIISTNATVFEFNPFEFGSSDPTLYAFAPMEFIGTNVTNGKPNNPDRCTRGFDNAGFILGTSSSLFNTGFMLLNQSGTQGILRGFAEGILSHLDEADADIADYQPNPFFGVNPSINPTAKEIDLTLVDGGLDGQNVPLQPLIQPARKVDVIFAVDSSADTNQWPNGTSLVATYERSLSLMQNGTAFPAIPDQNTFVNLGLNTRPTFFGCDLKNITGRNDAPLIVYVPNTPITTSSNTSTFQMAYSTSQRDRLIRNGYNVGTRANSTLDSEWPACAACAIVRRSQERAGVAQTTQCQRCFQRYCWDGTRNSTPPAGPFEPKVLIADKSWAVRGMQADLSSAGFVALGVVLVGLVI